MSDNAFGLAEDPQEGKTDPFADEPQAGDVTEQGTLEEVETEEDVALDETPAPEEQGEPEPEVEAAEAEAEEAEPEEDVPEVETVEEAEERLYAGKYKSPEELERGYSELSTMQREAAAKNAELTEYLRVAAQIIQESKQPQAPPEPDDQQLAQLADQYGTDVETIRVARAMAEEQAQQAITPLQDQMAQQAEEQQQREAYMRQLMENRQMVANFKATVELDDATETQMVQVFEALNLDETDSEMYPVAYEAAQNPALFEKLQAWPDLVTTEAGMREARRLASVEEGGPTQKRSRNTAATRQRAHVEAGGTGAAPEATEKTEKPWDVLELARKDRAEESVFGV